MVVKFNASKDLNIKVALALSAFLILSLIIPVASAASYSLTVYVYDDDTSSSISGASVYLDGSYKGTTDSTGKKTITGVSIGLHTVKVTKKGYKDASQQVSVSSNDNVDIYLQPKAKTYSITVNVYDENTQSVKGASVYFDGSYKGTTDSYGRKQITGVAQGYHTIKATKSGYKDGTENIEVWGNNEYAVYLQNNEKFTLTVIAKDYDTSGSLSGASVYLDGSYKGTTDSYGEKKITGVSQGYHTVKVTKTGYKDASQQVSVSSNDDATLYLQKPTVTAFTLTVSVYDDLHASETIRTHPISDASVYLDGHYKGSTDSSGKITIEISKGDHTIKVTKSNYDNGEIPLTMNSDYIANYGDEVEIFLSSKVIAPGITTPKITVTTPKITTPKVTVTASKPTITTPKVTGGKGSIPGYYYYSWQTQRNKATVTFSNFNNNLYLKDDDDRYYIGYFIPIKLKDVKKDSVIKIIYNMPIHSNIPVGIARVDVMTSGPKIKVEDWTVEGHGLGNGALESYSPITESFYGNTELTIKVESLGYKDCFLWWCFGDLEEGDLNVRILVADTGAKGMKDFKNALQQALDLSAISIFGGG